MADADVEHVFRQAHGQAVATLARLYGDLGAAEDAVQDAFVRAVERWTVDGIPANPAGWIVTTARRRAIDDHRRQRRGQELLESLPKPIDEPVSDWHEESVVSDDQLRLIFTCCHPALRIEHQVALTLRLLGGLQTGEIARSFLVGESAMARRLSRAKHKITAAGIPYRVPVASELPGRLAAVLAVIYLIYNTGADDGERAHLRIEGVRLARALSRLLPAEPEVSGLLALLLINESRASARVASDGSVILLADQDRSRWDQELIDQGLVLVRACIDADRPGPYQLQAAIQAVHASALHHTATDWAQIVQLYDHLRSFLPTAVVSMNRAIAVAEANGPEAGLADLDSLGGELDGYHLWHAARGVMLRRLGREPEAVESFGRALELAPTETARAHLRTRLGES